MAFRCSTRPHGRIGVVVCFARHCPESIRSTVGAITEYSEEAASTTLRHLLSTIRQVELPEKSSLQGATVCAARSAVCACKSP